MPRINLAKFGFGSKGKMTSGGSSTGATSSVLPYQRPTTKRINLAGFNIQPFVVRSPQYNEPAPELPRYAGQGEMAASQSALIEAQRNAKRDYNISSAVDAKSWRAQPEQNPTPVLEAMDKFNYFVQGLPVHSTGNVNENGRNTVVDFIGSLATVAFSVLQAAQAIRGIADRVYLNSKIDKIGKSFFNKTGTGKSYDFDTAKLNDVLKAASKMYTFDKGTPGIARAGEIPTPKYTVNNSPRNFGNFLDAFADLMDSGVEVAGGLVKSGTSPALGGRFQLSSAQVLSSPQARSLVSAINPALSSGIFNIVPKNWSKLPEAYVKDYLQNGKFGIVSVYTADATPEENKSKALAFEKETGYERLPAQYGGLEESFIVPYDETKSIGARFHQQGVILSDGGHHEMFDIVSGKTTDAGDNISFDQNADDFYTKVGNIKFSMDFINEEEYASHQAEANAKLSGTQGATAASTLETAGNAAIAPTPGMSGTSNIDFSAPISLRDTYEKRSGTVLVKGNIHSENAELEEIIGNIPVELLEKWGGSPILKDDVARLEGEFSKAKASGVLGDNILAGAKAKIILSRDWGDNEYPAGMQVISKLAHGDPRIYEQLSHLIGITSKGTGVKEGLVHAIVAETRWLNDGAIDTSVGGPDKLGFYPTEIGKAFPTGGKYVPNAGLASKTREFTSAWRGDVFAFTSDTHMWFGFGGDSAGKPPTRWQKMLIASTVSQAGAEIGMFPREAQAAFWKTVAEARNAGTKRNYGRGYSESLAIIAKEKPEIITALDEAVTNWLMDNSTPMMAGITGGMTTSATSQSVLASSMNAPVDTRIDLSKYKNDTTSEQVIQGVHMAQRSGFINVSKMGHLANTPIRLLSKALRDDPLKHAIDRLGIYDLLYGKETNLELRAGSGNPSIFNLKLVPATVRNFMTWGTLFTSESRMEFKDATVEADRQRDDLIKLDRDLAKLEHDEFVDVLFRVARGVNLPATQATANTANRAQDIANRYIAATNRAKDNLIVAGLDPSIFKRLEGRYLPAPFDAIEKDILPSLDELITVKPSLSFIKEQTSTQEQIIAYASLPNVWQDYREYMIKRVASEVRAAHKGQYFGIIARDPHTKAINPDSKVYRDGKQVNVTVPDGYVRVSKEGGLNAFALSGLAVPKWVASFIKNEFTSAELMEQLKFMSEGIGWWKWSKAVANVPTLIRNIISQATVQSLESGLSPLNLEDYIIRPLGAMLGLNKTDQKYLIKIGMLDVGLARDLEGLGFSPQEVALWGNKDKGTALAVIYNKLKAARNVLSTVYSFSDNFTKIGAFYSALREHDHRTARVLAALTSGDYSQRPPAVNFLGRGVYNGKVNPLGMIISSPFSFYKTVVEPQRVGNLIRNHPSLLILYLLGAGLIIDSVTKKIEKEYNLEREEAEKIVSNFQNYHWLNGKYVIPTGKDEGIDVTGMIPMVNFITEFKKGLVQNEGFITNAVTAAQLVLGTDAPNVVVNIIASMSSGYDMNYFMRYGSKVSIGQNDVQKLVWLTKQITPTWFSRLLLRKKGDEPFTLKDMIGTYKVMGTEVAKNKMWARVRNDPNVTDENKRQLAAALYGGKSPEQIALDDILGK
jgi:hypothetical protein